LTYKEFIKDFAKRTFDNLKIICDNEKEKKTGYEVTQLVNSCIGLLIFPKEEYFKKWKQIPGMEFPNSHIREIAEKAKCKKENCLCNSHYGYMLYHLRNAIAHFGIKTREETVIRRIYFTDKKTDGITKTIEIELEIGDIYNVLMSVLYLILEEKFPYDEAKEYAKFFKTELDIEGTRYIYRHFRD